MKYKVGDLVLIYPGRRLDDSGLVGFTAEVGMIVSTPHSTDPGLSLYNVYFTNMECAAVIEDYLEKL